MPTATKRTAKQLKDLTITGASGVDNGAHLHDGWGILKALDTNPEAGELLKAILTAGSGVDALADAMADSAALAGLDSADLAALHKALGKIVEAEEDVAKATWSAADQNDLPDSSFAYIEDGGEKDDDGKTSPRSKRHFPIRDADGNPDPAHVRNALARAASSPFGDKAIPKIRAAAEEAGIDDDAIENEVEKAGRKMAGSRLDRLKQLHDGMGSLLDEVNDEPKEGDVPNETKVDKAKLSPEAAAEIDRLEKALADSQAEVAKAKVAPPEPELDPIAKAAKENPALAEYLAKQAADMTALRKSIEAEQSARVETEFTALAKSLGGSREMAVSLAKAFGSSPEVGAALEQAYRQTAAAQESAGIFKAIGGDGDAQVDAPPLQSLDALAKARATEKGEDYHKAYAAILDTPEGRAAYKASQDSQRKAG